jgi:SAM-dependent methyltransferase
MEQREHWTKYWEQGHLSSFELQSNYDGATARHWRRQFGLLSSGARILDACAGNGAIALLAQDHADATGLSFEITAVDSADIDPARIVSKHPELARCLQSIRFIRNTGIEDLDDPPGTYDLITSQYGIEYTRLEPAAVRIKRLLAPGGCFSVISHAPDTVVVRSARLHVEELQIIAESGLFDLEDSLMKRDYLRRSFSRALDAVLASVFRKCSERNTQLLRQMGMGFEPLCKLGPADYQRGLETFRTRCAELRSLRARQQALVDVANRLDVSPPWYAVFMDQGLELVDSGKILEEENGLHVGNHYRFLNPA